jgi:enoyl-CoA hydratase/carnithine racemase
VSFRHVGIQGGGAVGRLTLKRPPMNGLTPEMMGELADAVAALERDPAVRAIVLDSACRAFSAGGDFAFLEEAGAKRPAELRSDVYGYFIGGVKALRLCAKPTVAAVNGAAAGAGCELALACDFRICSTEAMFQESWIKLGLISPLGGMKLLPQLVGLAKANEMLLLGRRIGGEEAARIGLVNECVAPGELAAAAMRWAEELAEGAPLGLRAMKEGVRRGMESSLAAEWEQNSYVQSLLIDSEDFEEGVAALKERRKPTFKGR